MGIFDTPQPKRGGVPTDQFEQGTPDTSGLPPFFQAQANAIFGPSQQGFGLGSATALDPRNTNAASALNTFLLGRGSTFGQASSLQNTIRSRAVDLLNLSGAPGRATDAAFQQLGVTSGVVFDKLSADYRGDPVPILLRRGKPRRPPHRHRPLLRHKLLTRPVRISVSFLSARTLPIAPGLL